MSTTGSFSPSGETGDRLGSPERTFGSVLRAYIALMKPRIIELLLVTTVPIMFLAAGGVPNLWLIVLTLVGGTLSAGGANALNCFFDRDIDAVMERTSHRPTVTGLVSARATLIFGISLSIISTLWFLLFVNWLSALLSALAILMYAVGYTVLLKRHTSQNIVWGGAAGCMPVLIGEAAVTGSISWSGIVLFMVVFFWTPAHYWPLALRFKEDYANAGVPMLPVVADVDVVARRTTGYSMAMVLTSILLVFTSPYVGWGYLAAAVLFGGWFTYEAIALQLRVRQWDRAGRPEEQAKSLKPMRVFHGSISYLSLLFLAVAISPLVPF